MPYWRIVRRQKPLEIGSFVIFAVAFALSLAISAMLLYVQGKNGLYGVQLILEGGFGTSYSIQDTLLKTIPIFLCSLGVALCFRLQVWNIGAEGQYVMGTLGGAWFVLSFPAIPAFVMLPGMFLCAAISGAIWASIPAFLRQKWAVNEIISTLMLNYIAIHFLKHLIYGPWKSPEAKGFPLSEEFAPAAHIAELFGGVHWGILSCLAAGLLISFVLKYTRLGYELEAAGSNAKAARYAGMRYDRLVLIVMAVCGALAGIAGIQESAATVHHIDPNVPLGYGFTAVVVAWLARLRTMRIAFFAIVLAGLRVGVENLQIELQVSSAFASSLEGIILLMVLAGQFFDEYTLKRRKAGASTTPLGQE